MLHIAPFNYDPTYRINTLIGGIHTRVERGHDVYRRRAVPRGAACPRHWHRGRRVGQAVVV